MSVSQQQVISLLENVLFESATQATANAATWEANAAATSLSSLAAAMAATGEEKIAATVVGYYLSALGRAPTAAEVGYYVGIAEQGLSQSQIAAGDVSDGTWSTIAQYFSHSAEFAARAGVDRAIGLDQTGLLLQAVPWLYESVLGRAASTAELSYYDNQVIGGTDLSVLFREFTASPEFHTDTDAQIAAALANYGAAATSGQTTSVSTVGLGVTLGAPAPTPPPVSTSPVPPPPPPPPAPTPSPFGTLTNGVDTIDDHSLSGPNTYHAVIDVTTPASATLNDGDMLTGNNSATLAIVDPDDAAVLLPTVTLSGIVSMSVDAAAGNVGTSATPFDVSGVSSLFTLSVTSSGNAGDYIKATGGIDVDVTTQSSLVSIDTASNITLEAPHLTTLDLATAARNVTLHDTTAAPTALTVNLNGVEMASFSDADNHVTALTITGTGGFISNIPVLNDTALQTLTVNGSFAVSLGITPTPIALGANVTTVDMSADVDTQGTNYFTLGSDNVTFKVAADTTVIDPGTHTGLAIAFGTITGLHNTGPIGGGGAISAGGHTGDLYVAILVDSLTGSKDVEYGNDGTNTYIAESDNGTTAQQNGFVRIVEITGIHTVTVNSGTVTIS